MFLRIAGTSDSRHGRMTQQQASGSREKQISSKNFTEMSATNAGITQTWVERIEIDALLRDWDRNSTPEWKLSQVGEDEVENILELLQLL